MFYLVTYDVAKNQRRKKVSDLLLEHGVRIQYSVFECDLTGKDVFTLEKKLSELV
jgi:CRISPR-associated protein Cas2